MSGADRAVIFGRAAGQYDRYRPSYPHLAISHVKNLAQGGTWLEVGAGTGIATTDMASSDAHITCLEPSEEMAEVLRGRELERVEVVVSGFEDWEGPVDRFDLIFAAQSWHWVDPAQGYDHALRLLCPGGAIALMWNVLTNRYEGFRDIYELHAPQIVEDDDKRIEKRDHHTWTDDLSAAGFVDVQRYTHAWQARVGAEEYTGLLSSYSDHMLLPERVRSRLLADVASAIGDDLVTLEYRTDVFSGKFPDV